MFDIGQKIVCINARFSNKEIIGFIRYLPEKDKVYTVRDIIPAGSNSGNALGNNANTCAVLLAEIVNPPSTAGVESGFACTRFRELEEQTTADVKEEELIHN